MMREDLNRNIMAIGNRLNLNQQPSLALTIYTWLSVGYLAGGHAFVRGIS